MSILSQVDPQIAKAIELEANRQRQNVVLIASENYTSRAVLEAQGSHLTNKYAEGLPGRRYYGGCDFVDIAEQLAISRGKDLFGAEYANVQPHSGAQANMAAYSALLEPGDTVLGMRLDQGGHLTHGSPVNFSGKMYNFISYGVSRETELIDYTEVEHLSQKHRPKVIVAGYTAYPRIIDFPRFRQIADDTGAILMVDMSHIAGLIAAGIHPTCLPHAQVVTATTHKTLRGPRGAFILCTQELGRKMDRSVFPFTQGGPLMHTIAAKAVCFREAMTPAFKEYQRQVVINAQALAQELEINGLRVVSGGTDNHLLLVDLRPLDTTGQEAEETLSKVKITVNKNTIPYDPQPPRITSGLRLGTPAITSRGFTQEDVRHVARLIVQTITHRGDAKVEAKVRREVEELTKNFPVPGLDI